MKVLQLLGACAIATGLAIHAQAETLLFQDFTENNSGDISDHDPGLPSTAPPSWEGDTSFFKFQSDGSGLECESGAMRVMVIQAPDEREDLDVYATLVLDRGADNSQWQTIVVRADGSDKEDGLTMRFHGPATDPNVILFDGSAGPSLFTWDLSALMTNPPTAGDTVFIKVRIRGDFVGIHSMKTNGNAWENIAQGYQMTGTVKTNHGTGSGANYFGFFTREKVTASDERFIDFELNGFWPQWKEDDAWTLAQQAGLWLDSGLIDLYFLGTEPAADAVDAMDPATGTATIPADPPANWETSGFDHDDEIDAAIARAVKAYNVPRYPDYLPAWQDHEDVLTMTTQEKSDYHDISTAYNDDAEQAIDDMYQEWLFSKDHTPQMLQDTMGILRLYMRSVAGGLIQEEEWREIWDFILVREATLTDPNIDWDDYADWGDLAGTRPADRLTDQVKEDRLTTYLLKWVFPRLHAYHHRLVLQEWNATVDAPEELDAALETADFRLFPPMAELTAPAAKPSKPVPDPLP